MHGFFMKIETNPLIMFFMCMKNIKESFIISRIFELRQVPSDNESMRKS